MLAFRAHSCKESNASLEKPSEEKSTKHYELKYDCFMNKLTTIICQKAIIRENK